MSTEYRFWLTRDLGGGAPYEGVIVMLNPSTADAVQDDPTIRRCKSFALRQGYSRMIVVNLYGLRATKPADLWRHPDPVGGNNDRALRIASNIAARGDGRIIVAWGANARADRVAEFCRIVAARDDRRPVRLWCLGVTKSGAPRHPLYVRSDQPLIRWPGGGS